MTRAYLAFKDGYESGNHDCDNYDFGPAYRCGDSQQVQVNKS
jgi:hypothetical protein